MSEQKQNTTTSVATLSGGNTPATFNFFDPTQFETMLRVSKLFANSELVPDMYKAKLTPFPANATPEQIAAIQIENKAAESKAMANCMIAIEISQRIGASPLMIMQNMVPIYGKPSWSSKFLISTVNTCGRFNPLKFKFTDKGAMGMVDYVDYVWDNQTRSKRAVNKQFDGKGMMEVECVAWTTARGSDEVLESSPITLSLAIQEGWYTKAGSKWRTMPKQMLMYRAASFWTNAYAPELSMGMKTVEEVQDIEDVEFVDVTEELKQEKAQRANGSAIGFDTPKDNPTPKPNPTAPDGATPASGEAEPTAPTKPSF